MILCFIFGHNYTRPSWGTELVRGTNPFCYRCGKAPEDMYSMNLELIEINQQLAEMIREKDEAR